jgi:DNA invertase Pin-like site-specific DNA recombinase
MIYGYLRVSSDQQDVNNQKQGVMELANRNGWSIDDWIVDDGVSGTKEPDKRELGVLMKRCKKGDAIICSEISRLGRKLLMVMAILEYCMKNEIMIYTVKDNYILGDNIQSTVLAFAFSLAAQIERDMIAMRTKEALKLKRAQGVLLGSPRAAKKVQYVNDKQIKKMESLLESGESISGIARIMGIHRITVAYHLTRLGIYKGALIGYDLEYANGNKIILTSKRCSEYGLSYKYIKNAVIGKKDLSAIGIVKATPVYSGVKAEIKNLYKCSEHPLIDHKEIEQYILESLTLPEIHLKLKNIVSYDELYDYIQDDTELSMSYRERGQLRVKSNRKRY